jgi:alpha-L-fucosidase
MAKKAAQYPHGDRTWWQEARFGMFIHWGLYSVLGRHEWVQNRESIPPEVYEKYQEFFEPDLFNPQEWARMAKNAGMKYLVITAKHHEGFCMFDSKYTDYKARRDYIREVVDAYRAEGLRVGFYYSLLDWHHPQFRIDCFHPLYVKPGWEQLNQQRDQKKYTEYMRQQVRELLTNYGKIDILWFDFSYPSKDGTGKGREDWESEKLLKLIRSLQPDILLDDRMDLPGDGDFQSPEQYVPARGIRDENGALLPWEGCQTFSGSWGYHRDEQTWKTPHDLITMLVNHVSRGGNLLLNVGPTARGYFDQRAQASLEAIGAWMKFHSPSIYGCTIAPEEYPEPEHCRYTYNPVTGRLFLHLYSWPQKFLHLPQLAGKVKFARFLHDGSEILRKEPVALPHGHMNAAVGSDVLTLVLPPVAPKVEVPVIEIFLN